MTVAAGLLWGKLPYNLKKNVTSDAFWCILYYVLVKKLSFLYRNYHILAARLLGMVWCGNNLFDIAKIHNALL